MQIVLDELNIADKYFDLYRTFRELTKILVANSKLQGAALT